LRPSLFVVALPRSLSTCVYHAARQALALRQPEWTTDGEILNVRRFAFLAEEGEVEGVKYVERARDPRRFEQLLGFLDQVAQPLGFAYKDVIQPFLLAEWLPAAALRILYIECPLADVAHAMLGRGWLYPSAAGEAASDDEPHLALLRGLARARACLAALPATRVRYDDLIADEEILHAALCTLYGGDLPRPRYLDDDFRRRRDAVLTRRQSDRYRGLAAAAARL
jgi:hypothetical protein